jgi:transcription antitermination factor NusG
MFMSVSRVRLRRWYCVQTQPQQELFVEKQISILGFDTELFMIQGPKKRQPLFRSFLFVAFNCDLDQWRRLWSLHGVRRIMSSHAQSPTPVPGACLEAIRYELGQGPAPPAPAPSLQAGDSVMLTSGPFHQFAGIVQRKHGERVDILLELFGRPSQISNVPVTQLKIMERKAA